MASEAPGSPDAASFVISALRDQGVDHLFMDPGGLNDAFMPAMTGTEGVRTVVAAFEGGAAYMADGYARATGGLGVCFGIGGPGVLNMATALAAAKADRSPVLAVSGEVPRSWEGLGGFQDASGAALDDLDALRPLTGASLSVAAPSLVAHHLRWLVSHALGRREPVHLSVPVDVQKAPVEETWVPVPPAVAFPQILDEEALEAALALFAGGEPAGSVIVLAGPGVGGGGEEALVAFAERFEVPVATTLAGKGVLAEDHPLSLGVFGYGGTRWALDAVRDPAVEVLVVVGSGLTQRDTMQWDPTMLPSLALVHIERDPVVLGRTWPAEVPVIGDAHTALGRLAGLEGPAARGLEAGIPARRAFLERIRAAAPRVERPEDTASDAVPMHPARVVAELRAAFPRDGVLCVDSGAHRAWFGEYWTVHGPGTHLSLTNLAPMGGAIPLGIGACLARPDRSLMVATGDGCMLMHGMELHTAAREGVPIVLALMNNGAYGNIWYRAHAMGPGPERLTAISGVDWVGFARALGAEGERVTEPDAIAPAVARAVGSDAPYLLDLHIDRTFPTPVSAWRARKAEWEDHH